MISNNTSTCQDCGGKLKYYDKVRRIVRTKGRVSKWVNVPRYQCSECGCIHRYLPDYIYPYKQYESEIIAGVIEGLITCETFGYEDYPCEMTMIRWKAHKSQVIDVIEAFTFDLKGIEATDTGNIIKYACRWKNKNGIQDLKKIMWYTQHLIDHLEKKEKIEEENN